MRFAYPSPPLAFCGALELSSSGFCERKIQGMTYFQALYFCYVSLLTIGYGDLAPQSNAGRPFFVLWSLIAVPTMTILISDLGSTVINKFKQGTFKLADFTVLPKYGVWRQFLERHQTLLNYLQNRKQRIEKRKRMEEGFPVGPEAEQPMPTPTIEELAGAQLSKAQLAKDLTKRIRKTADDMKSEPYKRYAYEEWVEITQLIRFTAKQDENGTTVEEEEEGLIEWDWIGEDSPMMAKTGEPEFVLDRLTESLHRLIRNVHDHAHPRGDSITKPKNSPYPRRGTVMPDSDADENDEEAEEGDDRSSNDGVDPLDTKPRGFERRAAGS